MKVDLDDVINLLIEEEILLGNKIIPNIKPGHGSCCTCQTCGRDHDTCVCEHNQILTKLNSLREK